MVCGLHAVAALVEHQTERILELIVDDRRAGGALADFVLQAQAVGLDSRLAPRDLLDRLARGGRHQGVLARVRPFAYTDLDDLAGVERPALLALDGVEDPRNLGAAARAAHALGATGLVIPRDRSAKVTPVCEQVAAGALAALPVAQVTNLARSLETAKARGLWVVGAEADARRRPWEVDLNEPIVLVVGGENRGVRRLVRSRCDFIVSIPMSGPGLSLNAADAACVLLYEMARQRAAATPAP